MGKLKDRLYSVYATAWGIGAFALIGLLYLLDRNRKLWRNPEVSVIDMDLYADQFGGLWNPAELSRRAWDARQHLTVNRGLAGEGLT